MALGRGKTCATRQTLSIHENDYHCQDELDEIVLPTSHLSWRSRASAIDHGPPAVATGSWFWRRSAANEALCVGARKRHERRNFVKMDRRL